ncbi:MAG: Na+/H+ antiporter subunit E [Oceanicaulis sp.]
MAKRLIYFVVLIVVLSALWLLLSGKWTHIFLLCMGAVSVAAAVYMTVRMGLLDGETVPFGGLPKFLGYWAWLGGEIFKANLQVVKLALAPSVDIKPVVVRVPSARGSDLAKTTFANSITLTPGTVTVEVEKSGFLVHALDESFADMEAFRDMERRSIEASDGKGPA